MMTAGTDMNVLKTEMSIRRPGNLKKARKKAITSANGDAMRIALSETLNDSEMISQMPELPDKSN